MEQCFWKNKLIGGLQKPKNNTQCVLKEDWGQLGRDYVINSVARDHLETDTDLSKLANARTHTHVYACTLHIPLFSRYAIFHVVNEQSNLRQALYIPWDYLLQQTYLYMTQPYW